MCGVRVCEMCVGDGMDVVDVWDGWIGVEWVV